MPDTTVLVLQGMGIPPYSARGIQESLEPIAGTQQQRRTVNGKLVDLSDENFRKYRISLTCEDQQAPAFEGIWPGKEVRIDCVSELSIEGIIEDPTESTEATESTEPPWPFARTPVPGSVRHESGFTFYRPRLQAMVMTMTAQRDEWGARIPWTMVLEEV